MGFLPEDYDPPPSDLWPDNWPAIQLYRRIATQWRAGFGGPYALDYNVVFHELDRMGLEREDYDDLLGCIRTIEDAALPYVTPAPQT